MNKETINDNKGKQTRKSLIKDISRKAKLKGVKFDYKLFNKDSKTLKYLSRAGKRDFVLTKRTIAELSPWTIQMVKSILKHDIIDISSGLKELLERGATLKEIEMAFSLSPKYERLAKMNYEKANKNKS